MKAHAESIWLNTFNVAYANRCGVDFEATVTRDESQVDEYDVEFVPAAAYLELKAKLETAEYSANGFESLYDAAHSELVDIKSRLDVANSRIASLREGIEDIRSLRRINCVDDVPVECDFYLNRDSEES